MKKEDFADGKNFAIILCLFVAFAIAIMAYVSPIDNPKNFGNYSQQPSNVQIEMQSMAQAIAPVLILGTIPLLLFLYQDLFGKKITKKVN